MKLFALFTLIVAHVAFGAAAQAHGLGHSSSFSGVMHFSHHGVELIMFIMTVVMGILLMQLRRKKP